MWDRDMKKPRQHFGRKIESTGYIYLTEYLFREAEVHLKLRSFLHESTINYDPRIVHYIHKHELYRQCPPRIVKY